MQYDIFISYRRDGGEFTAKIIKDRLENLGYRVFFDVESLRSGGFNEKLYSIIEECKDFILVLSPNSLDRCSNQEDWVRSEIVHALKYKKNIVPIILRGFNFPKELPKEIDAIRYQNGLESNSEFFDEFVSRVQSLLSSRSKLKKPRNSKDKKFQIFISSTYSDLIGIRRDVQDTILKMQHFPVGMELFSADNRAPWEIITKTIDDTDYYVLLIGHRYGSEDSNGIGYTEKEFQYAVQQRIPIIAFIRNRDVLLKDSQRENDPKKIKKLNEFIKKVSDNKEREVEFWSDSSDLINKITIALYKEFNNIKRPGWIRSDK